jgi:hypothetical protein
MKFSKMIWTNNPDQLYLRGDRGWSYHVLDLFSVCSLIDL